MGHNLILVTYRASGLLIWQSDKIEFTELGFRNLWDFFVFVVGFNLTFFLKMFMVLFSLLRYAKLSSVFPAKTGLPVFSGH